MNPIVLIGIIFVVLLLMNMPIAFAIGIAAMSAFFAMDGMNIMIAAQKVVAPTQSFTFLAVPFFLIAGNIMNTSGITKRLVHFATVLTGHMTGGLAQVSLMLSALMGGISGSAVADASMEARFLGPSMIKSGYSKGFTGVILAFGGLITATIPPSLGLIVYGFVGEVSIGRLFIAGILPGVLLTVVYMTATYVISRKRNYAPVHTAPPSARQVVMAAKESFWALLFPVILIVGIRFGIFTPSEAGAFAIVYAVVIGKFVHKELRFRDLMKVLDESISDNGNIMAIVTIAGIFGYVSSFCGIPQEMAMAIGGISSNKYVLLFIVLVFLLIAGMVMESTVNTLLFTPIFLPIVAAAGVDPVHFGILMMTVVTMGCMTPPVAVSMFAVCSILECSTTDYIRECWPYLIATLITLLLLVLFPDISMVLPNLVYPS
jgi:tripartite ATP-independent transporter DctM subunit